MNLISQQTESKIRSQPTIINCSVILLRILTKKLHEIADEDDRNEAIAFVSDMVLAVKEWPR